MNRCLSFASVLLVSLCPAAIPAAELVEVVRDSGKMQDELKMSGAERLYRYSMYYPTFQEHTVFEKMAWLQNLVDSAMAVQQGIETIKMADDTIALAVKYGADYLEFINWLSGPREGRFFYDSATIRQLNRTRSELDALKDWNLSFSFGLDIPTNRIAVPSGVRWDTIERRLGVIIDSVDSNLADISPMEEPIRKGLEFSTNSAVLNFATRTVRDAANFTARQNVITNQLNQMQLSVLRGLAELDARKTDADNLRRVQAGLASHNANLLQTLDFHDTATAAVVQTMFRLNSPNPGGDSVRLTIDTQKGLLKDVFFTPDEFDDASEINHGSYAGDTQSSFYTWY